MAVKKQSLFETSSEDFTAYFHELLRESDRGCVLLVTSRIDELLQDLHWTHMKSASGAEDKVLKQLFDVHAPLSTLSGKIKIALGYGLVCAEDFQDFEVIRNLRNSAAHTTKPFGFELAEIRAVVQNLTAPKRVPAQFPKMSLSEKEQQAIANPSTDPATTKHYFVIAGTCLSAVLMDRIGSILHKHWKEMKKVAVEPE